MSDTKDTRLNTMQLRLHAARFFADIPKQTVVEWCCENLIFDEPGNRGPFTTQGREYIEEPLNDWANNTITDCVECFGSQAGKTGMLMGGMAWSILNDPCGLLWVMPSERLAQSFSETRWIPMLKASPALAALIPTGADRHDFKKLQQQLGASVLVLVGSNSPANLASRPVRKVILDEVDKFGVFSTDEADPVNLADQRTKGQVYPQRRKTSTPSMVDGPIWQEFLKGDQRRYFLPCPKCGKAVIFAWSTAFTVMPKQGCEAFIVWDKEARRKDGWDLDRVAQSARAVCPHCAGDILDGQKTLMMKKGEWRPTAPSERGFRSRHLSSLYACNPETSFGKLAVKFLQAKRSLLGLQGFINGDLAEPYQSQDTQGERVELVSGGIDSAEKSPLMTVDCQQRAPYFWYVVREWHGGDSHAVAASSCDTWEELRDIQQKHSVQDKLVMVDSGFGAKSDAEVYRNCARFGAVLARPGKMPALIGWMPSKGMPGRKRWKNDKGLLVPYYLRGLDPFLGTSAAGRVELSLFEFSGDFFKDILDNLRKHRVSGKWSVAQSVSTETYWRHMDCETRTAILSKATGRTTYNWLPRSAHWPNHLYDCEVMQIAFAAFLGFLNVEEKA